MSDLPGPPAPDPSDVLRFSGARFPVQSAEGRPKSVPWVMVAEHEVQALKNHQQTLARLAERGGLGADELWCVIHDQPFAHRPRPEWCDAWLSGINDLRVALVQAVHAERIAREPMAVDERGRLNGIIDALRNQLRDTRALLAEWQRNAALAVEAGHVSPGAPAAARLAPPAGPTRYLLPSAAAIEAGLLAAEQHGSTVSAMNVHVPDVRAALFAAYATDFGDGQAESGAARRAPTDAMIDAAERMRDASTGLVNHVGNLTGERPDPVDLPTACEWLAELDRRADTLVAAVVAFNALRAALAAAPDRGGVRPP